MATKPTDDDSSRFMPLRKGVGHYDANEAITFFKRYGKAEKFAADALIFQQNEKSNKQSLFNRPVTKALTTPLAESLFARKHVHRMYLLTEGEVILSDEGALEEIAGPGDVFGEMAVLSEIPDVDTPARRTATAKTKTAVTCYSLDGDEVQKGLAKRPEFALMLMSVMFERLRTQVDRLSRRPSDAKHHSNRMEAIFDKSIMKALRERLGHNSVVHFRAEDRILKEGSLGSTMYVVTEGEVAVAVGRRIVEKMGPGGVFGEMALVDGLPRAATAVARTECALLSMSRPQLVSLIESDPVIGMAMMRAVAERLRYMNALLAKK